MKLNAFLVIGIFLVFIGLVYQPLQGEWFDDTPPNWAETIPYNGLVAAPPLVAIQAHVIDDESPVTSVNFTVGLIGSSEGNTTYPMGLKIGDPQDGVWMTSVPLDTVGDYYFMFTATNTVGLTSSLQGTFTIYDGLDGDWYINDQLVEDATEYVGSTSRTVLFRFEKTKGLSDNETSVWVNWVSSDNQGTIPLEYQGNSVWTSEYTFPTSTDYQLHLMASDKVQNVTFAVITLQIGYHEQPEPNPTPTPTPTLPEAPAEIVGIPLSFWFISVGAMLCVWGIYRMKPKKEI